MAFQLVLVTDSEITVWHTDLGHIYGFAVDGAGTGLVTRFTREVPDAERPAALHQDEALHYAIDLARDRRLIAR